MEGVENWPAECADRYREAGVWRDETLGGLLAEWAERSGESTAIVSGDERISYTSLDRRAAELATGLLARGLRPGDRVVVQLPNTATFAIVLFGLLRAGIVPVLALPAHRRTEIEHFVTHAQAVAYFIPDHDSGFDYRTLAAEIPTPDHVFVAGDPGPYTALADVPEPAGPLPDIDPGDVAVLLISGGTTGKPKLIPRTHRDYAYNARGSAEVCSLTANDVYLAVLPAAHNFPLACPGLLGTLGAGGRVVMAPAPSPDVTFGLIERERVTVTALVPPLVRLWVDTVEWDRRDLSSLRLLQVGGAKLDTELAGQVRPVLGTTLQQVFGMAEGLLNYTRLDDPDDLVTTTQGRPMSPFDEVRVVRDGVDVLDGGIGELWTRGPYTLRGYYNVPEYNASAFTADGFYRTGDLVRRLPSGHLVVEGRVKDVINRGGENVSAGELEEHLLAHPAVAQAAVVGVPDQTLGEIVCAAVVLVPDASVKLKELKAFLSARGLARFKLPDRLAILPTFPVTAVGKIDKKAVLSRL
ncbi:mycobactin salicyl-AMP ligase [Lentzea albidocapillata subsp. violacea]|uniref:Mycobactin salicyl-AMP ligase n=1 Tax=Lentzea albidocapillata subsp. violacea TaxID=128104 RepID=A0A1G9SJN6_9PSEU|nr:AMP-binding protein [Lentzea albidocapillata]SDM35507.1 mycobactin salicyl-AMP ligase [Lentzea albidocapillata subsp. violacea]